MDETVQQIHTQQTALWKSIQAQMSISSREGSNLIYCEHRVVYVVQILSLCEQDSHVRQFK